jgi:hypothetical protein
MGADPDRELDIVDGDDFRLSTTRSGEMIPRFQGPIVSERLVSF